MGSISQHDINSLLKQVDETRTFKVYLEDLRKSIRYQKKKTLGSIVDNIKHRNAAAASSSAGAD